MGYTSKTFWLVTSSIFLSILFNQFKNHTKHPDAGLNMEQLLNKFGYHSEIHQVITEDGYQLTLFRIPHGKFKKQDNKIRTPVLLMHGVLQTSIDFINQGSEKSLGLILADKGYDVWLGNARGSTYSRKHVKLNPDIDDKFWDYSMHEIGVYDLPAFIDHILNVTKQEKLHYIGYSQGTQAFFVLASERPEYNNKIRLASSLAPAIYLKDPQSPVVQFIIKLKNLLRVRMLTDVTSHREIFSHDSLISAYLKQICDINSLFVSLCLHHIKVVQGDNADFTNKTSLSLMISNIPSGMSLKQLQHTMQMMQTGEFHQFDFGNVENLNRYSQDVPPFYNLSNVKIPVALYYASGDWVINYKNMERVQQTLPNIVKSYLVPREKFNHYDFIYNNDVVPLLYDHVIDEISKY